MAERLVSMCKASGLIPSSSGSCSWHQIHDLIIRDQAGVFFPSIFVMSKSAVNNPWNCMWQP